MKKNLEDSGGAVTKSGWKTVISIILIIYSLITVFLVGETIASSFKTKIELVYKLLYCFCKRRFWKIHYEQY